jgi:tRNA dimethylallyltransferase
MTPSVLTKDQLARISREAPVLIAGPTASGKSALAMQIAARDDRVIVNADALQVYAAWRLLTARPSPQDEAAQPHALYGHVETDADYSAGHWLRQVAPHLARPVVPVVIVGGTGLFFLALTQGLTPIPATPPEIRAEGNALRSGGGMAQMIADLDPATAARTDLANPARVQRAWEVWRTTGRGLAAWQADTGAPLVTLNSAQSLVLNVDRDVLAARIDSRFDAMMAMGALAEVRANAGKYDPARPWARAIGAAQLMAHLDGHLPLSAAVAAAKIATHQYAKRQRTWFRARMGAWTALDVSA